MSVTTIRGYEFAGTAGALARARREVGTLDAEDVLIRVAGCGVCHTDLGFLNDGVRTRHPLPLILGHEISGHVEDAGSRQRELVGRAVVVPAVLPCGECALCRAGRSTICASQIMPGNDRDGGFADRVVLPGRFLCPVPGAGPDPDAPLGDAPGLTLRHLAVVADAVSTAYQAVVRSGLRAGDVAFVIGGGGVGGFTAQIAKALGAKTVVCDVHDARLEGLAPLGFDHVVNVKGRDVKDVRKELHGKAKEWGIPSLNFKVFECSGTAPGQTLAYTLLSNGATLLVVGFTRDTVTLRLSNLMAFDATVHGSWGCPVEAYPAVLSLIYQGKVVLEPFISRAPMSKINEHLKALSEHKLEKRLVMDPRA